MYPKINIGKSVETITKGEIADYLNLVISAYGPPCDFCEYYDDICGKALRFRIYDLEYGPYASWAIRKHCKEFQGKNVEEEQNEELQRKINSSLDWFVQQSTGR